MIIRHFSGKEPPTGGYESCSRPGSDLRAPVVQLQLVGKKGVGMISDPIFRTKQLLVPCPRCVVFGVTTLAIVSSVSVHFLLL
jgi:hypothetical protein